MRLDSSWPNIYDRMFGNVLPSETEENQCDGHSIHANQGTLYANPNSDLYASAPVGWTGLYNRHLISNPGMFYHYNDDETPLAMADIQSKLILKVIIGDVRTPTKEEMLMENSREIFDILRTSREERYYFDETFANAWNRIYWEGWGT